MRAALACLVLVTVTLSAQSAPPGTSYYTRVDATVACGGATGVQAMPALKAEGFKTIVNLRQASEEGADIEESRKAAERAGLKYVHIPVNAADLDVRTVDTFLETLRDPSNTPVYIHCASANRVGMMWLIKRVMMDGWAVSKATDEAERIGLRSQKLKEFALDYLRSHGKG